jgi:FMN reductase
MLARTLAVELARALDSDTPIDVDLAELGPAVLNPADERAKAATADVLAGELLVIASPTYKATYSGLLKAFLDRLGTGALAGAAAVPIMLGGAPNHELAVDVHFVPLLLELGARVPARGLFVLETDVPGFADIAEQWADAYAQTLLTPAVH